MGNQASRTSGPAALRRASSALLLAVAVVAALLVNPLTAGAVGDQHEFAEPVYDITAAPDGSILVGEGTTVKEIRNGAVADVIDIPSHLDSPITGLDAIGRRSLFAVSGRLVLEDEEAHLYRVSQGKARRVADIKAFEAAHDPDVREGPRWNHPDCNLEEGQDFNAGPQTNPYHLTALSGSEVLMGDAAGNTLLWAKMNGQVDWVALFTPPVDDDGEWLVRFPLDETTDCYIQPVPTSVDIGADGAYYVGELTGVTPEGIDPAGLSRVWRIEPGARNVVCPSAACTVAIDGLTAVMDVAFGPDGLLYLVEYDAEGWLAAFSEPAAGTLQRCDVATGACEILREGLDNPGAITFDKSGQLWLLENVAFGGTVSRVALD